MFHDYRQVLKCVRCKKDIQDLSTNYIGKHPECKGCLKKGGNVDKVQKQVDELSESLKQVPWMEYGSFGPTMATGWWVSSAKLKEESFYQSVPEYLGPIDTSDRCGACIYRLDRHGQKYSSKTFDVPELSGEKLEQGEDIRQARVGR